MKLRKVLVPCSPFVTRNGGTIITILQGPFHLLINCEKFSLSTNLISNIANLQSFKCLRILSMGRNTLKSLQGIEGAADTLEQLWISYNQIDRLKPIRNLLRLKVNQTHLKYELLPTSEGEHIYHEYFGNYLGTFC